MPSAAHESEGVADEPQREIVAVIGPPPRPEPAGDWRCWFQVAVPQSAPSEAHGIDGLAAVHGVRLVGDHTPKRWPSSSSASSSMRARLYAMRARLYAMTTVMGDNSKLPPTMRPAAVRHKQRSPTPPRWNRSDSRRISSGRSVRLVSPTNESPLLYSDGWWMMTKVQIDFQRVQTWLFSVPRLRAMLGANTLLGEVLRVGLPDLARQSGAWSLAPVTGDYSVAHPQDPLKNHDNPAADAQQGILGRDGGHFVAMFSSGADVFADAAADLLHRELPGLRFRVSINGVEQSKGQVGLSTELPVLAPCEWTGRGLASVDIHQGTESALVSRDVSRRHEAARRAEEEQARDLASLLISTTQLKGLPRASTFQDFAGTGYLALIHADGNGVGSAVGVGTGDVERATFFHRNRVMLRRALQKAIDAACVNASSAPLLPLMLGGDDLLLICRAETALPFVVTLCETLTELQSFDRAPFELTLGVGLVFARPKIPIHRLHEVAEQLAGSAKRRFRGFSGDDPRRSVVDWTVYTTAWVDAPEEVRRRDWLRGEPHDARVLSQRPMDVLGNGLDCLQGLVRGAAELEGAPRSQLRYLVDQLPRGRTLSDLAFAELSKKAKEALERAGVQAVWKQSTDDSPWLTEVLDLVEIYEIGRLGRADTVDDDSTPIEEVFDGQI